MQRFILLSLISLPVISISAQFAEGSMTRNADISQLNQVLTVKSEFKKDSEVIGSIFLDPNFRNAKIAGIAENWPVRYDAYRDEIEVKKGNDVFALKKENPFSNITLLDKNESIVLADYKLNKKSMNGYLFTVLQDKDFTLLKKQSVQFKKGKEARTTLDIATPDRFVPASNVYFLNDFKTQKIVEVDKKGKNISTELPELAPKVKDCLKSSPLSNGNETDVKNFAKCLYK